MSGYVKPEVKTNFSKTPIFVWLIVAMALYAFCLYSVADYIFSPQNQPFLNLLAGKIGALLGLSLPFVPLLLVLIVVYSVVSLILGYLLTWLISKLAEEVTVVFSLLVPIVFVAFGIAIVTFGAITEPTAAIVGIVVAGIGLLMLLFVLWRFRSLRRSGRFVEFSAQLVLDEKAVLGMPILLGLFSSFTGLLVFFGEIRLVTLFTVQTSNGSEIQPVGFIIMIAFAYTFLIVYLGFYYFLNAYVISYASDWYRGLDPDLPSAHKDVKQILPVVIKFAFVMATVKLIVQLAASATHRQARGKNVGSAMAGLVMAGIASFIIQIIGAIWEFLNYFTLISAVQNKTSLSDSIRDSAKTSWNSFMDVIVGETGYGISMFVFAVINTLIWFTFGFAFGFSVFPPVAGFDKAIIGIVLGVVFIVLSSLPYTIVTMPMKIAFQTFIYSYAKDYTEGFSKPSKLPVEFRDEFKTLQSRHEKRRMRDPTQIF